MMSEGLARAVVVEAFELRAIAATLPALQAVQAIGRFEGRYGEAFQLAHNWGAIQVPGLRPPCGPDATEATDTHASGAKYQACFRRYSDDVAGAADLVRELYRRPGVPDALNAGDADAVAERMRATGYFEAPVDRYALAIASNAAHIASAIGEPVVVTRSGGGAGGLAVVGLGLLVGLAFWRGRRAA